MVTFLMVCIMQNTQNRAAKAIQLKLAELILGSGAEAATQTREGGGEHG